MSTPTAKETLQVTFSKEKLDALRFYMNEKDLTVEGELRKHIESIYGKYVPSATRRYLERNDNEQENQTATTGSISEKSSQTTPKSSSNRGRRGSKKAENEQEQAAAETINTENIEETLEQTEGENQGMAMSM